MPQGPQNGPKVARSVEFEFERDLREVEVELVLKVEFELERELELELRLELELLRDARRALELQAKDPKVAHKLKFEFEGDLLELEVELVLKLEFGSAIWISNYRTPTRCSTRSRTPSLAELPLCCFSGFCCSNL